MSVCVCVCVFVFVSVSVHVNAYTDGCKCFHFLFDGVNEIDTCYVFFQTIHNLFLILILITITI